MKPDKLIHIKFDYENALGSKKDFVSSELGLVKINKMLKEYHQLRLLEIEMKKKLESKIRGLKLDLGRLRNLLPEVEAKEAIKDIQKEFGKKVKRTIPKEEAHQVIKEMTSPIPRREEKEDQLESQLAEIQRRLASLQS